MNTRTIIAAILIILGIMMLGCSGIAFTAPGEAVNFRGLRILQTTHHYFIPQAFGAVALIGGGIVLLFAKPKKV
jgi:hypothetical protein